MTRRPFNFAAPTVATTEALPAQLKELRNVTTSEPIGKPEDDSALDAVGFETRAKGLDGQDSCSRSSLFEQKMTTLAHTTRRHSLRNVGILVFSASGSV